MRYFVAVVIVLFALYGSLNATYGQVPPEQISLFPEIPSRPNVSHTPKHDQAIATFEAANKGWEVRRNVRSRTPRSMLGPPRFVPGATPEIIARNFLKENRGLLNMTAKTSHLSLLRIDEHEGAVHVSFQQDYRGIPVEGAVYGVHLNNNGVYYAAGDYYDDVAVADIVPRVQRPTAIAIAQDYLGPTLTLSDEPEIEQVILPYGDTYHLAWKIVGSSREPLGRWMLYVSATTGKVLGGRNLVDHGASGAPATASGMVYGRHPDAGPVVQRDLNGLNGQGHYLANYRVKVMKDNIGGEPAYETDGTFYYTPSDPAFKEVMVYYHINGFADYMGYQVGHYCFNFGFGSCRQVRAVANDHNEWYRARAEYFPPGATEPPTLFYGIGGVGSGQNVNSWAMEASTIAHEYMHFITEVVTHDGLNFGSYPRNQTRALDEAFSDFFGCMYADSPVFGEYVQRGPGGVRNLDNSYTMSDWGTVGGLDNDYWSGSQIFSGALWDIREMFGKGHATKAVYSGLRHLNFADPDFVDARDAIVAHATTIYYPGTCALKNIFASRGVGSPCSGSSSVVANKDTGLAGQDANTSAMSGMSLTAEIPETYVLGPSAPNPTLHRAVVRYGLPKAGHVVMVVYDALGREIVRSVDEYKGAGFHSVTVETGDLPAGLYFYSLQVDTFKETRAMVVFK